jgi:hypothetical protein
MYDDFASFKRGWERIFIECARRKSSRLVAFARRKFIVHLALPGLSLAALAWGVILFAIDGPALSAWVLTLAGVAGTLPYWTSMGVLLGAQGLILYLPALPIGTATTIGIMLSAARTLREGGVIRWGGREYRLVDESAAPSAESAPKSAVAVAE